MNFMMPNVGQNDKYLISKLRNYNITIDKIDQYMAKLDSENVGLQNGVASMQNQYELAQFQH